MCPAKEIFNINTNAHFIKKHKREEISSDEESVDREHEIHQLIQEGFDLS